MGIKRLIKRAWQVFREEGIKTMFLKTKFYLRDTKHKKQEPVIESKIIFGDVLFINGCYLPHPSRYRVSHQREQMLANGIISGEVFYTDLTLEYVKRYRAFIFYRCPYTDMIGDFIKLAKSFNKAVIYDIDDLVIDTKYTDNIPYLSTISKEEKKNYDEGVDRMQKTLRLCDAAITTTEALANELKNYVPEVYINRNTASDAMCEASYWAMFDRDVYPNLPDERLNSKEIKQRDALIAENAKTKNWIKIGYFSGSITHNDDVEFILPVLVKTLKNHENAHLYFVGELTLPDELKDFKNRIHALPFVDWRNLPKLIASVDINIVPLCDTVFNAAKSENKWLEAALVKVPTIASNIGAFAKMVENGETGILCNNNEEWLSALDKLIIDNEYRLKIAKNAYEFVMQNCITLKTGIPLCEYVKSKMARNIAFVLPSTQISGGVLVVLKHCAILKKAGYDVFIINDNVGNKNIIKDGEEINVLSTRTDIFHGSIDMAVGSLWSTMDWVMSYRNIRERAYLVQSFETNFYKFGNFFKFRANQTYSLEDVKYITISPWCRRWLRDEFNKNAAFVHNGLERSMFKVTKRNFQEGNKIKILIEGNSDDDFKNVDESFKITGLLDRDKYDVYFLSYQGTPKKWYIVDKFLHKVPYEKISDIYNSCDILLKSSILESFSYPPLEMMATGGFVVARPNDGNAEYLVNGENCMLYDSENLETAVHAIERISSDSDLRDRLLENGLKTADSRDWQNYQKEIIDVYSGKRSDELCR